jgi:hypothetical protein
MNLKLKKLIRTILRLDSEGSVESLYGNYSACLRHLVRYVAQKDDSDRKALLAVLRNMAFSKHQDVGQPIDEATIGREMKNTFRKLLLQQLGTTTEEDIDRLYESIEKVKSNSSMLFLYSITVLICGVSPGNSLPESCLQSL